MDFPFDYYPRRLFSFVRTRLPNLSVISNTISSIKHRYAAIFKSVIFHRTNGVTLTAVLCVLVRILLLESPFFLITLPGGGCVFQYNVRLCSL